MSVFWVTQDKVLDVIRSKIVEVDVILDIGCGVCPQTLVNPCLHICVEPHLPYIEHLQQKLGGDPRYVFLNCTWDIAMRMLPAKSVDTVFALDVIEHLEKAEGFRFLHEAERVARRQIVIFTPLGFYPQSYEDPNKPDRWGMDGGYWQTHRSGWWPEDFVDWELVCCESFHLVDQNDQPLEKPFGAIWAFRNLGEAARSVALRPRDFNSKYAGMVRASLKRFLPHWTYSSLFSVWRVVRHVTR